MKVSADKHYPFGRTSGGEPNWLGSGFEIRRRLCRLQVRVLSPPLFLLVFVAYDTCSEFFFAAFLLLSLDQPVIRQQPDGKINTIGLDDSYCFEPLDCQI